MASPTFTLTSYEPVYAVCPEVRIPEEIIREQALRWLQSQIAKEGEEGRKKINQITRYVTVGLGLLTISRT